ncbi:hypothetical protein HG530_003534 [Fusarium avenaceum]|nr:hypothetical protein HG530_003534 [Fusarium avenaceum]
MAVVSTVFFISSHATLCRRIGGSLLFCSWGRFGRYWCGFGLGVLCLFLYVLVRITLDAVNNTQTLGLSSHFIELPLALKPDLDLFSHIRLGDKNSLLLRVAILKSHLLNFDFTRRDFIVTKENGEGHAVGLSGLKLCRQLRLNLETLSKSHDVNIDVVVADSSVLFGGHLSLSDREDSINAERNANTRDLTLAREHANKVVVPATSSHAAYTDRWVVRTVIILRPLLALFLGMLGGRVLLSGRNLRSRTLSQIEGDSVQAVEGLQILEQKGNVLHTLLHRFIRGQTLGALELLEQILLALENNPLSNSVGNLGIKSLLFGHFLSHVGPWHSADLKDAVENLSVVQLDCVSAVPTKSLEYFCNDAEDFGVGKHGVVGAGNVEIALVEFSHTALGHGGLISAVDLGNVISLDVLDLLVHGEEAGERDCQVISQRADLTTLIGKIIDELAVLSIFTREDLSELENRSVDCDSAVTLEDLGDGVEDVVTNDHVLSLPFEDVRVMWLDDRHTQSTYSPLCPWAS